LGSGKELDDEEKEFQTSLRSVNGSRIKKITIPIQKLDEIRSIVAQASKIEIESYKLTQDVRDQAWMERMADEIGIEIDEKDSK
jgi:restriction endonuclease S subunit